MSTTSDRNDPRLTHGADNEPVDQAEVYLVLSDEDRARGFVRPLRLTYLHTACRTRTSMGRAIAETYAAQPGFYGATYCVGCRKHLPVGVDGEFVWVERDGTVTDLKVGA